MFRISDTQGQLGLTNGALFGVPIPAQYEAVGEQLQNAVEQAVREADANGVSKSGKAVTPWLLKRVGELTQGRSLASSTCSATGEPRIYWPDSYRIDVALIQNTARVGRSPFLMLFPVMMLNIVQVDRSQSPIAN